MTQSPIAKRAANDEATLRKRIASIIKQDTGDITSLSVQAIVCPTNSALQPGGGHTVSGQVHAKGGPMLTEACRQLHGCQPGEARLTKGFLLPAKYVIHTVGSRNNEKQVLANCYRHCLELCQHHRIRTVAIPCIATGAFSFDPEDACKIALSVVRAFLMMDIAFGRNSFDRIIFSTFSSNDTNVYRELLPIYFPGYS
ncbi:hypothetical protein O0I10_007329 [Lichtheimia ornata]|uniref:Macro domain-containing protein n=1 Tax=Lichtheimia ornata TaxID=688661 RepID=A0AAD7V197_9FUNG|nr:uncharacterized protein O0I10_007329 [Lichtheimia ornata]KAJ8656995.1 hypothetical protein O0I10_007329 [Lichtheimia ornata]